MARFHKLKVSDVRRESADAVSVAFEVPPMLQPEYKFTQGQYLTLKINVDGEELRRSYSICTSPFTDNEWRVAVKEVNGGKVSTFINRELKVGDSVEVMTPMGNFHSPLSGAKKKMYYLFAGGSGITPILSILKSVLYVEKQSEIVLFYANRDEDSVIFKGELAKVLAANAERLRIVYIYDQPKSSVSENQKGFLTQEKIAAFAKEYFQLSQDHEFFICGPGPMMEVVKDGLKKLNIKEDKIHIEYFSAVLDTLKNAEKGSGEGKVCKVKVVQYGIETEMDLASDGITILDAALEAGVDVPFACKGAVCCTCRAKVLEGKVKMDANFALTDKEVEQGYILTCQSHPLTDRVVVDYDAT